MSKSSERKAEAKAEASREIIARADGRHFDSAEDKANEEGKRQAAHAHVMTHHAFEMDDPDAHKAAAKAHEKIAKMHKAKAGELEDEAAEDDEDDK